MAFSLSLSIEDGELIEDGKRTRFGVDEYNGEKLNRCTWIWSSVECTRGFLCIHYMCIWMSLSVLLSIQAHMQLLLPPQILITPTWHGSHPINFSFSTTSTDTIPKARVRAQKRLNMYLIWLCHQIHPSQITIRSFQNPQWLWFLLFFGIPVSVDWFGN